MRDHADYIPKIYFIALALRRSACILHFVPFHVAIPLSSFRNTSERATNNLNQLPTYTIVGKRRYEHFQESMQSLLQSGKHSDFVITCGDDTYNVHKSIVCSQSDFFDAASRFGKEGEEGKVDLPDDDPETVKNMMQYLYGLDYHLPSDNASGPIHVMLPRDPSASMNNTAITWARRVDMTVWKLGTVLVEAIQRYHPQIYKDSDRAIMLQLDDKAQELAVNEVYNHVVTVSNNFTKEFPDPPCCKYLRTHAEVYALAEKYNISGLKEAAAEKFQDTMEDIFTGQSFYDTVRFVYTSTPDTDDCLRDIVAGRIAVEKNVYGMYPELG
ncbi:hypothetical protein BU26DRAFT_603766 [Trematosphaeria pertusa]|uniref:BTB domain-containing protein n=1 Tax=Trematosphaeria pertusa TaxID=390896 RepID=A0A6A6IM60_9PLEO|nr:uncharacterized protein BU26DRAFT_603766 [Trematosphaeria pertusa]KAF2251317.1 hypothetical protein BU26DRAFT_603766 [Trematosphaeria pertusa]